MLASSVSCSGNCTYTIVGASTTVSGHCTGSGCPRCPSQFTPSTLKLIAKLPKLIPDSQSFTVSCSLVTADAPVLKLYDDYVILYGVAIELERRSALYRNLSILLGVVSMLVLGGLVYMLVARREMAFRGCARARLLASRMPLPARQEPRPGLNENPSAAGSGCSLGFCLLPKRRFLEPGTARHRIAWGVSPRNIARARFSEPPNGGDIIPLGTMARTKRLLSIHETRPGSEEFRPRWGLEERIKLKRNGVP